MADYRKVDMFMIIDRSGSMGSIVNDAIGGYNAFLKEQKEIPGEAIANLLLFDHEMLMIKENVPLSEIPELDTRTYIPRGSTALFDAIALAVGKIKEKYKDTISSEIPAILFMILTDGEENASHEVKTVERMKEIITECRGYGWEFVFIAADQDAFSTAASMGVSVGNTMNFSTRGVSGMAGTVGALGKMSASSTKFRKMNLSKDDLLNLMKDDDE